jgi:hypothetical protein
VPKLLKPRLEILPPALRQFWSELSTVPDEFVLYGGTALALRLGHRESIDFDFFSTRSFNPATLYGKTLLLSGSVITQQEPNTLTCLVHRSGSIKVAFFGVPHLAPLRDPERCTDNGLQVASLIDLAASKVSVVQQRAEAKDYKDIDALMAAGVDLPRALAAAMLIYGPAFMPTPTLKALSFFGDGDLPSLPAAMQRRLARAAAEVDPQRLPHLKRTAGQTRKSGGAT